MRILSLILILVASGCATQRPLPEAASKDDLSEVQNSRIDISYILGHSQRKISLHPKGGAYVAQAFLERRIMRETEIDSKAYLDFYAKTTQFIRAPKRNPTGLPADGLCRTPFVVTLQKGSETQTTQGCRGSDDGALSRLVWVGEFLLYSKK
jgi:hypothetical protein